MLVRGSLFDDGRFPNQASCTLPQVLDRLAPGQTVWFDDGKLQGEVEELRNEGVLVRVLRTGPKGAKLQPGKGLYFPDTELRLDPLLPDDLLALEFAVREVDMIGYSFVQRSNDVACLQQEMAARRPDWRGDSVSLRRSRRVKRSKTFQRSSFKRRGGSLSGS